MKQDSRFVLLFTLLLCEIFSFLGFIETINIEPNFIAIYSLCVTILCVYCFYHIKNISLFGMSGSIFLYTVTTQFGLVFVYFFLGEKYLSHYQSYTLRFLASSQISKAMLLSTIALIAYTIAIISSKAIKINFNKKNYINQNTKINQNHHIILLIGYIFLVIVFFYYIFYLAKGGYNTGGSYLEFRENVIDKSNVYAYILMLYSMGIIFIIAAGTVKQIRLGLILFCMTAVILLMTGNKGEVFYPLLASVAVAKYRGFNINKKIGVLVSVTIFLIIPFITANREIGVVNGLENISFNFTDSFTEMGMQIRVSVYMLEEFKQGMRNFLWGYSYYSPIINILNRLIPFLQINYKVPLDYNFSTKYESMGFSQVAESYCNFGLIGVVLFFYIIGKIISTKEKTELDTYQLTFWGCITSILINVTRNRFAFVIGQALITLIIIKTIKFLEKN